MTAPNDRDIEVHLFGPGYGESVLVHLGYGEWLIVDSCQPSGMAAPAPLAYLESIGVDPGVSVKVIVASHWHDDHVRGLSKIVERCPAAAFWCSKALFEKDFLTLTNYGSSRPMTRAGSGVDEFGAIVTELRNRAKASGEKLAGIGLNFALANRLMWRRESPVEHPASIHALSPSDTEMQLALQTIRSVLDEVQTGAKTRPRGRVRAVRPNNTAIALHVRIGDANLLLGADLEEVGANPKKKIPPFKDCGWTAVVKSDCRPTERSTLFKVAHHGSITAHCDEVWTEMLAPKTLAILTPFRNGSVNLPTAADAKRIRSLAGDSFITARSATKNAKPSNPVVARAFASTAKAVWAAAAMGHVRAAVGAASTDRAWQVELEHGAIQL